jgi:hypothetical protein
MAVNAWLIDPVDHTAEIYEDIPYFEASHAWGWPEVYLAVDRLESR